MSLSAEWLRAADMRDCTQTFPFRRSGSPWRLIGKHGGGKQFDPRASVAEAANLCLRSQRVGAIRHGRISEITIDPVGEDLEPGPVGEYIEVVDADPGERRLLQAGRSQRPRLLAQNGLAPSEIEPAVPPADGLRGRDDDHRPLRAGAGPRGALVVAIAQGRTTTSSSCAGCGSIRTRCATATPTTARTRRRCCSAISRSASRTRSNTPGTLVFTCLSHDIIAHETTHALLDGVHPRFNEPVNPDVLAFHEAFADIVALFQHFSYPGRAARPDRAHARRSGQREPARPVGAAVRPGVRARQRAARRARARSIRQTGKWRPRTPDVRALDRTFEPHDRGAILVAAVFGAFLKVYRARTRDLYRIATDGTGVLREATSIPIWPAGLPTRRRAARSYVLQMCIRAIDYCPPVGITFGDYLRGIVTADYELNPDDPCGLSPGFRRKLPAVGHPSGGHAQHVGRKPALADRRRGRCRKPERLRRAASASQRCSRREQHAQYPNSRP